MRRLQPRSHTPTSFFKKKRVCRITVALNIWFFENKTWTEEGSLGIETFVMKKVVLALKKSFTEKKKKKPRQKKKENHFILCFDVFNQDLVWRSSVGSWDMSLFPDEVVG